MNNSLCEIIMPARNHGSCIHHRGLDVYFDTYIVQPSWLWQPPPDFISQDSQHVTKGTAITNIQNYKPCHLLKVYEQELHV